MKRPTPTPIFHTTHIDHLPGLMTHGLQCDRLAQDNGLVVEIGHRGIKDGRRSTTVRVAPGGVVADYAPFYYRAYGPFLSAIGFGRVPQYSQGLEPLVILMTTVEHLLGLGLDLVYTDRNAALALAAHSNRVEDLDDMIGWDVINGKYWNDFEDGRERRMAECLVHGSVPWEGVLAIATKNQARFDQASELVGTGTHQPQVLLRPDLYQ